ADLDGAQPSGANQRLFDLPEGPGLPDAHVADEDQVGCLAVEAALHPGGAVGVQLAGGGEHGRARSVEARKTGRDPLAEPQLTCGPSCGFVVVGLFVAHMSISICESSSAVGTWTRAPVAGANPEPDFYFSCCSKA